jgi:hypothetical protein
MISSSITFFVAHILHIMCLIFAPWTAPVITAICHITARIADVPELTGEGQALHNSYVRLGRTDSVSEGMWRACFSLSPETSFAEFYFRAPAAMYCYVMDGVFLFIGCHGRQPL